MQRFDIIEYQQYAREIDSPKELFALWDDVCKRYERGQISKNDLEEMRAVVWPHLRKLTVLRSLLDGLDPADHQTAA